MTIEKALESGKFLAIQAYFINGVSPSSLFKPGDIHYSIGQMFQPSLLETMLQGTGGMPMPIHSPESKQAIYDGIEALAEEYDIEDIDALWDHMSDRLLGAENANALYNKGRLDYLVKTSEPRVNEKRCAALRFVLFEKCIPDKLVGQLFSCAGLLGFREKLSNESNNDSSQTFSNSAAMHNILSGLKNGSWDFIDGLGFSEELMAEYGLDKSKYEHIKEPAEAMNAALDLLAAFARVTDREMLWSTLCETYGGREHNIPPFDQYVAEVANKFGGYDHNKKLHGTDYKGDAMTHGFGGDLAYIALKVEDALKDGSLGRVGGLGGSPNPHTSEEHRDFCTRHWEDIVRLRIAETVVSRMTTARFKGQYGYGNGYTKDAARISVASAKKIINLLTSESIREKHKDLASQQFELGDKTYEGAEAAFMLSMFSLGKAFDDGAREEPEDSSLIAEEIMHMFHGELHHETQCGSAEERLMRSMHSFEEAHEFLYIKFFEQKQRYDRFYAKQAAELAAKDSAPSEP